MENSDSAKTRLLASEGVLWKVRFIYHSKLLV